MMKLVRPATLLPHQALLRRFIWANRRPFFFANPAPPAGPAGPASEPPREHREDARNQASVSAQEEMEKQMAEEEENAAQEAAEREHAATAFLEEAYRRRNHGSGRPEKVSGNENGAGSCSS